MGTLQVKSISFRGARNSTRFATRNSWNAAGSLAGTHRHGSGCSSEAPATSEQGMDPTDIRVRVVRVHRHRLAFSCLLARLAAFGGSLPPPPLPWTRLHLLSLLHLLPAFLRHSPRLPNFAAHIHVC